MAGIVNKDSSLSRLQFHLFLILFTICISPIIHFAYPPPPPPLRQKMHNLCFSWSVMGDCKCRITESNTFLTVYVSIADCFTRLPAFFPLCNRKSCQVLLSMGAEVDSRDNKFRTPLMWASQGNHTKCADVLLDSKASADLQDVGGDTALHVACGQGHPAIVTLLLDHGASSTLRNKHGLTCLEVAAKAGSCDAAMAIAKHKRLAE